MKIEKIKVRELPGMQTYPGYIIDIVRLQEKINELIEKVNELEEKQSNG